MSANLLRAPQPLVRDIACVDLLEPLSDVRSSAPARVLGGVGRQDVPTAPAKVLGGIARYDITEQIGEGTYGKVFRGTDRINGQRVALKRMTPHHEGEGFPRTETREIKTLKSTSHPSMVKLIEVVTSLGSAPEGLQLAGPAAAAGGSGTSHSGSERATGTGNASGGNAGTGSEAGSQHALAAGAMGQTERSGDIYMVFEYVDYDLAGLIESGYRFEEAQVKSLAHQLLTVLDFLHTSMVPPVLHRDLKCANLLLTDEGRLKLGDFGLSRVQAQPGDPMTNNVITLWYRPPELLLGAREYSAAVDMWSVGCILIELIMCKPPFPARTEPEQIRNLISVIGTPPADSYLRSLPGWAALGHELEDRKPKLREYLAPRIPSSHLQDLLLRLLEGDPRRRMTAREALASSWFKTEPSVLREDPVYIKPSGDREFPGTERVYTQHGDGGSSGGGARKGAGASASAGGGGSFRLKLKPVSASSHFLKNSDHHEFTARERRREKEKKKQEAARPGSAAAGSAPASAAAASAAAASKASADATTAQDGRTSAAAGAGNAAPSAGHVAAALSSGAAPTALGGVGGAHGMPPMGSAPASAGARLPSGGPSAQQQQQQMQQQQDLLRSLVALGPPQPPSMGPPNLLPAGPAFGGGNNGAQLAQGGPMGAAPPFPPYAGTPALAQMRRDVWLRLHDAAMTGSPEAIVAAARDRLAKISLLAESEQAAAVQTGAPPSLLTGELLRLRDVLQRVLASPRAALMDLPGLEASISGAGGGGGMAPFGSLPQPSPPYGMGPGGGAMRPMMPPPHAPLMTPQAFDYPQQPFGQQQPPYYDGAPGGSMGGGGMGGPGGLSGPAYNGPPPMHPMMGPTPVPQQRHAQGPPMPPFGAGGEQRPLPPVDVREGRAYPGPPMPNQGPYPPAHSGGGYPHDGGAGRGPSQAFAGGKRPRTFGEVQYPPPKQQQQQQQQAGPRGGAGAGSRFAPGQQPPDPLNPLPHLDVRDTPARLQQQQQQPRPGGQQRPGPGPGPMPPQQAGGWRR